MNFLKKSPKVEKDLFWVLLHISVMKVEYFDDMFETMIVRLNK